eukprot:TRINITY_DN5567_c0_g1_i2.p1 TRINITY_DN5567_c0_g1~~TRINITY_DN5567_c0_g1_i2.p1  ORF type:complete len:419 (+),score=117.31 TRINITY_DN5567_c0_g1_i2:115-1371(+)
MEKASTTVPFACQQCHNPVKLSWMHNLNEATVQAYADASSSDSKSSENTKPTNSTANDDDTETPLEIAITKPASAIPSGGDDNPDSRRLLAQRLFDQLSSESSIDHPLCETCTHSMLDMVDDELKNKQEEKRELKAFLTQYRQHTSSQSDGVSVATLETQLGKLDEQIGNLTAALASLEVEEDTMLDSIKQHEAEIQQLQQEEAELWRDINKLQLDDLASKQEHELLEKQYAIAQDQLEMLKRTNVYNDTFHIWFDGHFGTINGFKLGRLPAMPVEWDEINAGLGQALLLLDVMATRLNFSYSDYKLRPRGSLSKIEVEGKDMPLYGPPTSRMFGDQKFDRALVAFLACLSQFKDHVETLDPHFKLPYDIDGDIIRDPHHELSIKYSGSSEEGWTKALKFTLANMKWCLAWTCKQMTT